MTNTNKTYVKHFGENKVYANRYFNKVVNSGTCKVVGSGYDVDRKEYYVRCVFK